MKNHPKINRINQRGVVTVEFTLVATLLFFAIFAIIGIARTVYIYNAANNATRLGARLAVVCAPAAANNIRARMVARVSGLTNGNINIDYNPAGCNVNTCNSVTVAINNFSVAIATPANIQLGSFTLPNFSTTLVRESMNSTNNNVCN